ncbi:hypothetical protein AWB78_01826 [Caballeronia calidae]|uniref:Uncharacterized protein n=1 Tax=Caballeronia calidae TaxID=1777139 RepID=A0A158AMS3_9BURK|nr:hypothetical protein AWB78_01826 [Caballeronia calidae]
MQKIDRNVLVQAQIAGGTAKSSVNSSATNTTDLTISITG